MCFSELEMDLCTGALSTSQIVLKFFSEPCSLKTLVVSVEYILGLLYPKTEVNSFLCQEYDAML